MTQWTMEMNFCRRCGAPLRSKGYEFHCANGHMLFLDTPTSACAALIAPDGAIVMVERGVDPAKGTLTLPGGFCNRGEGLIEALTREVAEEVGATDTQYETPEFWHAGIDLYAFGGELWPTRNIIFKLRLKQRLTLRPADDVNKVLYLFPKDVNLEKIQFPVVREALRKLRNPA